MLRKKCFQSVHVRNAAFRKDILHGPRLHRNGGAGTSHWNHNHGPASVGTCRSHHRSCSGGSRNHRLGSRLGGRFGSRGSHHVPSPFLSLCPQPRPMRVRLTPEPSPPVHIMPLRHSPFDVRTGLRQSFPYFGDGCSPPPNGASSRRYLLERMPWPEPSAVR